ncbi:NUDIX domain-containing protein [Halobellus sp. EA9]|uniref:NUDIX domain-containing protein n=1 Tax=Halobellus sp. EA9 TaxID=3421647 RepID=UPI003EB8E2BF
MTDWSIVESVLKYDCGWFIVGYDLVNQPSGDLAKYYWVDRPTNGLGIVALCDGQVAMVEQYRPKLKEMFLECPGGDLKEGESYAEAAARELEEETGLQAGQLEVVTEYYPSATMRYKRGVVVATDLERGEPNPDDDEYINWQFVPASKALELARTPPTTGWTLTTLLEAKERGYLE